MLKLQINSNIEKWNAEFPKSTWYEYFTLKEMEAYSNKRSAGSLLARYLIKKALINKGLVNDFLDIEILNEDSGKPRLSVIGIGKDELANIHFSISHSKTDAAVLIVFDND